MSKLGSSQYIQDAVKEMFHDFKTDRRGFILGSLAIAGSILSALSIGITYRSRVLNEPIEGPFFRRKTGTKYTVYTRTDGNEDLSKPVKYLDAENVWESDFIEDIAFSKSFVVVKVKNNGNKKKENERSSDSHRTSWKGMKNFLVRYLKVPGDIQKRNEVIEIRKTPDCSGVSCFAG